MNLPEHLLVHNGLLDATFLTGLLGRRVEIVHLRIKPGHNVLVAWQDVDTREHGWTEATVDPDKFANALRRAERVGHPLTVHQQGEVMVFSGAVAADRKLARPLRDLPGSGWQVLRYNPQRRLVAVTGDGLVVRVHATSAEHLGAISTRWQGYGVPAISMFGHGHVAVSPWWGIADLAARPSVAGTRAAGAAVAKLHAAGQPESLPEVPVSVSTSVAAVAESAPRFAGRVGRLGERLAVLLPELSRREPATELHGDLSPDQVLVDEAGQIRLIDFDRAGAGPASRDLGSFRAACRRARRSQQAEEFLRGYRQAGGVVDPVHVAVWEAYAHLSSALNALRHGRDDWEQQLADTLDLAEAALELAPPAQVELAGQNWTVNRAWPDSGHGLAVELKNPATGQLRAASWSMGELTAQAPGTDPKLAIPEGEIVSHRLRKRAVIRSTDGQSYTKIVRAGKAAAILEGTRRAEAFRAGFRMPEILASTADTVTLAALEGRSLHRPELFSEEEWHRAWAEVSAGLQATWATGAGEGPVHAAATECEVLRGWAEKALAFVNEPGDLLAATERACAGLMALPEPELVACHRDLHSKQLLWSPEAGPGLLDVDTACRADPALDVGNLRAHALWRQRQGVWNAEQTRAVLQELDRVGVDEQALEAYQYATTVRLVCVYAFRPKYRARAMELL
ncbi:phosphotransferase [Corynebacterium sp. YIM 101645]|uniref:Phosphotransferase n=1 Tax=Corynebacterium lemuris TaxID=1859292 RepID=A0ABT2FZR1_9CORY|nr:phosphotransferase [Corynebacterium lemuris]MCS5480732.1 phosphotransferase [Corynebacterium lemuris]